MLLSSFPLLAMSSLRHVVKRTVHKERHQPANRAKFGLLEKKKDYLIRAKENHRRTDFINNLKKKAFLKNPDEFYFKMNSTKTREDGKVTLGGELSADEKKLLVTQDIKYVVNRRQADIAQAARLEALALPSSEGKRTVFLEDGEEADNVLVEPLKLNSKLTKKVNALKDRAEKLTRVMQVLQVKKDAENAKGAKKTFQGSQYRYKAERKK